MILTYEEAKAIRDKLTAKMEPPGAILRAFPKGAMGLTPDHIKASDAYRNARAEYEAARRALQSFNAVFTKVFKKEIQAERADRYSSKPVTV